MRLILASASPRRKELVRRLSVHAEICPSTVEEVADRSDPVRYVQDLAALKARDVFDKKGGVVLGADTVVVYDGEILEKPRTIAEADEMFRKLCGRTHKVITGICIVSLDKEIRDFEVTEVTFGEYDEKLISAYILSGAPFDKAGGYGVQDIALKKLITGVNGDFDNVIGLPVKKVEELLKQFGSKS